MKTIMENLQKNLHLLEGWSFNDDGFFAREHLGILSDMKEFIEYDCIVVAGLSEYEVLLNRVNDVMMNYYSSSNVLEKVFDKDAEIGDELHVLARSIDLYGLEKYKVYVDAVMDRALLQCERSLTTVLAFVEFLVDMHEEILNDESVGYRLKLMLEKYIEVDYQKLELSLPVAYRCMHKVAKVLSEKNLTKNQLTEYWLENDFVSRFID